MASGKNGDRPRWYSSIYIARIVVINNKIQMFVPLTISRISLPFNTPELCIALATNGR
jgi:hypothetical protein